MNGNGELAKNNIGNVYKCAHGVVHINCRGGSLHFTEEVFMNFAIIIKEASYKIMDEEISKILKEGDIGVNV